MKSAIALLLLVAVFLSGCAGTTEPTTPVNIGGGDSMVEIVDDGSHDGDVMEDTKPEEKIIGAVTNTVLLVDKNKYLTGGSDFDTARQYFTQQAGKGYKIAIESDKQVEVTTLTDENCALRDDGEEFEIISTKTGMSVTFESNAAEEKGDICIHIKALENGQVISHILVDEISF